MHSASPLILAAALAAGPASNRDAPPFRLQFPLDCQPGRTCFIQQYFDHDPGPAVKDYRCGTMSYEGHDGTDFRVPTMAAQRAGVSVLAAADGVVTATRDGMDDISVAVTGSAAVAGRECGNGVMINHPGGWQTQYCHLAKGSVKVRPGQVVKSGAALGRVGESGDAAFPHLHLNVFEDGKRIDPFAYGAPAGSCNTGTSLWTGPTAAALAYHSPDLINQGFADGPVTQQDIEEGRAGARVPTPASAAVVAYVRAIGLQAGDVLELRMTEPGGRTASASPSILDHDKAQWMMFAGVKRPAAGWPRGDYGARFTVRRGATVVMDRAFTLRL